MLHLGGKYLSWALNVPTIVIVLAFVVLFIARWRGGYLNEEAISYYAHYTSDKPILVKLLDWEWSGVGYCQASRWGLTLGSQCQFFLDSAVARW